MSRIVMEICVGLSYDVVNKNTVLIMCKRMLAYHRPLHCSAPSPRHFLINKIKACSNTVSTMVLAHVY